jgi:hypothetical protein
MRILALFAILAASAVALFAQTPSCPQYQHIVSHPAYVTGPPCENGVCPTVALHVPEIPDTCEDDLHTVTEAEWQMLQATLHELVEMINEKADRMPSPSVFNALKPVTQ